MRKDAFNLTGIITIDAITRLEKEFIPSTTRAELVLADGRRFSGYSIGAPGLAIGEVVFNTSMTGYQEILTDPSYSQQIVTLTYPHIGNTGTCSTDAESFQSHASGLVIRSCTGLGSNWRNQADLPAWLRQNQLVAIAELDTRSLTRHLRQQGSMAGCIITDDAEGHAEAEADSLSQQALMAASGFPGLSGLDLAQAVTCDKPYQWLHSSWALETNSGTEHASADLPHHVVAMDFGVKHAILRMLVDRGCRLTVVPATTSAKDIIALQPDGVFLSNGPGDPEPCTYAIETIKTLLELRTPLFGICLGHQLLALAAGGKTVKMKFGHHGANHPVLEHSTGRVMISSQNHGFAVDPDSAGSNVQVTHTSLFDKSIQGIEIEGTPAFGFQGHPEASPGPHDMATLFDRFIESLKTA